MRSRLCSLFLCLALFAISFATAQAKIAPELFTQNSQELWYKNQNGQIIELKNNTALYQTVKNQATSISSVELGSIPLGTPTENILERDADNDGLDDEYEKAYGTNPDKKDTDGDSFQDKQEILRGFDPVRKIKALTLNRATYSKFQGKFVWHAPTKQLWYISSSVPKRFFVTSRQRLAWRYLRALAVQNPVASAASPSSPNTSTATCLPENCTQLDWKTRAQRLNLPTYEREVTSNGKLILKSEKFQIVMPDDAPNSEEFGKIKLYELRKAYQHTERLLGRPPFAKPDTIKEEYALNLSSTGLCCGSEEEGFPLMWNAGTRNEYLKKISLEDLNTQYYKRVEWSKIIGNHELTHRFVRGLYLSSFLDEGLANYAQDQGGQQPMTCKQGGYEQSGTFTPYTFLCRNDEGMTRLYNSGDCFWQRIEEKYGPEMIKKIMARIYRKDERETMQTYIPSPGSSPTVRWNSFSGELLLDLEQAFVPEIGQRFWQDFRDFGLSPTMADGVTYQTELARAGCQ